MANFGFNSTHLEDGDTLEELLPSDWSVSMAVGHFSCFLVGVEDPSQAVMGPCADGPELCKGGSQVTAREQPVGIHPCGYRLGLFEFPLRVPLVM